MFVIDENGIPRDVRVLKGLGQVIDGSVTEALRQWRFRPLLLNGQSATAGVRVEVKFELPGRVSSKILEPPRAMQAPQR